MSQTSNKELSLPYGKSDAMLIFYNHVVYDDQHKPNREEWCRNVVQLVKICDDSLVQRNKAPLLYSNDKLLAVIYNFVDVDVEFIIRNLRKYAVGNFKATWRLYHRLPTVVDPVQDSPSRPHLLVLVGMTPFPAQVDDFNNWYTEEHIHMLSRVPGWMYSRRYSIVACSTTESSLLPPDYLAVHAWASQSSFDSDIYHDAVSTPWRMRVVEEGTIKRERLDLNFVRTLSVDESERQMDSLCH